MWTLIFMRLICGSLLLILRDERFMFSSLLGWLPLFVFMSELIQTYFWVLLQCFCCVFYNITVVTIGDLGMKAYFELWENSFSDSGCFVVRLKILQLSLGVWNINWRLICVMLTFWLVIVYTVLWGVRLISLKLPCGLKKISYSSKCISHSHEYTVGVVTIPIFTRFCFKFRSFHNNILHISINTFQLC